VCELNPGRGSLAVDEFRNAREHFDVLVLPNPEILGTDASFGHNSRRFREDERGAADCATAEMHEMPVRGETVGTRILAHGRNDNPITKQDVANLQAIENHRASP
jgi:hypothetical protein